MKRIDEDGFLYDLKEKQWKQKRPEWFEENHMITEDAAETKTPKEKKPDVAKAMEGVMEEKIRNFWKLLLFFVLFLVFIIAGLVF